MRRERLLPAAVVALATLPALVAAGCGAATGTPTGAGRPPARPADGGLLERHDAPPPGIRRQIAYYVQGGGLGCAPRQASSLTLDFARSPLHAGRRFLTPAGSRRPERGEDFAVCVFGADGATPIRLSLRPPTGRVRHARVAAADDAAGQTVWTMRFGDRAPLGRWTVAVRQGARTASRAFTLAPPPRPEYHVVAQDGGRTARIGLLGLLPHERAQLLLYRSSASAPFRATFATAVVLQVGADGVGELHVPIPQRPPGACYVVKAEVRGRLLDDLDNTLSLLGTPPG